MAKQQLERAADAIARARAAKRPGERDDAVAGAVYALSREYVNSLVEQGFSRVEAGKVLHSWVDSVVDNG